jgi:hypothetical protein
LTFAPRRRVSAGAFSIVLDSFFLVSRFEIVVNNP